MEAFAFAAAANADHHAQGAQGRRTRPVLICFSPLRWTSVTQRPQHLMARAARHYDVYYFEEPRLEAVAAPRLDLTRVAAGVTLAVPMLPAGLSAAGQLRAQHAMLHGLLAELGRAPRVFWYCTPMALRFSAGFGRDATIFDVMEERVTRGLPAGAPAHDPAQRVALEHDLFARSDLVFCAGQSLYEAKRHRHTRVYAFPNSIDRAHFAQARSELPLPPELESIPRPRLGYFGVIDERLDLDLLHRVASDSPEWHWVMLGPVAKIDPASLPRRANLHWLGGRSYRALPAYLAHFDLGVMPFALNETTRFSSPTKTPAFLAAGLPVVSTPIHDVVHPYGNLGLVAIAGGWEQFLSEARKLLRRPRDGWLADVDRFLAGTSWDRTWQAMDRLINGVLNTNPVARTDPQRGRVAMA